MTVRPGQFGEAIQAASTLNSAAGRTLALSNSAWGVLVGAFCTFVATATVGNRQLVVRILDQNAANIIFQNVATAVITAGQTVRIQLAAGLPNQSFTTPLYQIIGLPVEMPIAQFSSVLFLDNANVDPNDTIAANFVFAM